MRKQQPNSPFLLQHVHYQSIHPPSFDQIPHHASKMSGGVEKLIFPMLIQVFISGCVYLKMTGHKIKSYFCSHSLLVTRKFSQSLFSLQIIQHLVIGSEIEN